MEETLQARERDYEELLLLSHDAYHAKEMAQADVVLLQLTVLVIFGPRGLKGMEKHCI